MKKLVAICTLSFFLLSLIPSFAYDAASINRGEIYFEKNFDDAFYGSSVPFDNMTVRKSGNRIETDVETNGNRYMLFEKYSPNYEYNTGEGNSNFEMILTHAVEEGKMVVQFDVMPKETATKMRVNLTDNKNNTYAFSLDGYNLCGNENILATNEWTTIRAIYNFADENPYISVYADDKLIKTDDISIKNFWRVRFHSEKTYQAGTYCFDNFVIYSGEPVFDSSIYELNYKSVVKSDNNVEGVSAISIYGDYIIDGIKGRDAEIVKCESDRILLSCEKLAAIYNTQIDTGEYLIYDEALARLGKIAVYDDRGFVYWNDIGENPELSNDEKWMVHNSLMYERPVSSYLIESVKKEHPRLAISQERIEEIKSEVNNNEYAKWYFDTSKTRVDNDYYAAPLNDKSNNQTVMMKARTLLTRVKNLAIWYHLMEDSSAPDAAEYEIKENVKNKIWENIEAVINDDDFPHWQPNSGLDNAEMAAAVAYAYDWLYNDWNVDQKKAMEEALYRKALVYAERNYGGQIGGSSSWWINAQNSNQNAVINGGYILCAISIIDKYPDTAGYVLENAIRSVENFQNSFYPDGAWLEGTTYWTYSMKYWVPAVSSIKLSYGTDFGLLCAPGLDKSPEYIMNTSSLNENYNYHDSELNRSVYYMGSFYALSKLYNEPLWADWKLTYDWHHQVYYGFDTLINFPTNAKLLEDISLPKDAAITRDAIGAFREDWLDPNGMYLFYHGGYAYPGHGHCDTGSFVYEYDGVRFAVDLPTESYSFSGNRLDAYRVRPEGHNCLVINPDETPGHNTSAFSPIERFETNNYGGLGIINMSDVYADYAINVNRGFKTDDNRNSVIIRDEIKGIKESGEVYWFMHTYADTEIEISDDFKTAVLTRKGKSIKFELLTDAQNFELKVMDAEPLDTSPQISGQSENSEYKKLAFVGDCTENEDMYIQVKLSPMDENVLPAGNIALDEWQVDSLAEIIYENDSSVRAEVGDKELFSFIAVYKGEQLYSVFRAKNNSYDGMTATFEIPEGNDFSAKLYVWNNKENLVPLMEAMPISIEKN